MARVIRSDRLTRWLGASGRALAGVLWPRPERPHPWFDGVTTGRARLRRRLPWLAALYALIVITSAAGAVLNDSHRMVGGIAFLLLLPYVAGLWLAARRPLDGWRLVSLLLLVTPFVLPPPVAPVPPLEPWQWCLWVPVLLLAGMGRPARDAAAVGGVSALLLVALTWLTPWPVQSAALPLSVLALAVPLVIGASVGARWSARRALTEEQARVAAAQAERGALAERARIAREMHDVVAHHMSMIAVRCETAPYRIDGLSEAGRSEIAEIGAAARTAMTEMQGLLGVLRASDPGPDTGSSAGPGSGAASEGASGAGVLGRAELAPQPSLGDLAALLEQSRAAGLRLTADLGAEPSALAGSVPDAVGLTVYRIAQEALTNASRHAPDAAVDLRLRRTPVGLELVVRSEPAPGSAGPSAGGGGHGVTGMRERAALHGGELAAGPDPDGGFTVRALLPVPGRERGHR